MEVRILSNGLQIITHKSGRQFVVPVPKPHPMPPAYYRSLVLGQR